MIQIMKKSTVQHERFFNFPLYVNLLQDFSVSWLGENQDINYHNYTGVGLSGATHAM